MNRPSYLLFKKCNKCGEILHVSRFHKSKSGKYGVRKICKECRKEISKIEYKDNKEYIKKRSKEYYKEHKEEVLEWQRIYNEEHKEEINIKKREYYENNKEDINNYHKKWYMENKEEQLKKCKEYNKEHKEEKKEYHKKYYQEHKEEINEYCKKWRKENPEKCLNLSNKRRNKMENRGSGINEEQWYEMMNFFDWKCAYSDEYIGGDSDKRTIDHIIPITKNGEHEVWNCVPMYASYNYSKHNNNMLEWYLKQPFFSIERLTKIYEWRIYAYWKWNEKER